MSEGQDSGCNRKFMGLHSLKNKLSIIPQIPFLFKGSIRDNLDLFSHKSDQDLCKALQESDLKAYNWSLPNELNTKLSNTSQVFSVGQKQLICLARAILRKNKYLFWMKRLQMQICERMSSFKKHQRLNLRNKQQLQQHTDQIQKPITIEGQL